MKVRRWLPAAASGTGTLLRVALFADEHVVRSVTELHRLALRPPGVAAAAVVAGSDQREVGERREMRNPRPALLLAEPRDRHGLAADGEVGISA